MNEAWKCCIEEEPKVDGNYYVYISNIQLGDEIRIVLFENGIWRCRLEKEEMIIAWKHVIKREITNSKLWLEEHKKIIQKEFQLNEYHSKSLNLQKL